MRPNPPPIVFPTPVGVFLITDSPLKASTRLPHARGGVSDSRRGRFHFDPSSPRPWRCFSAAPGFRFAAFVFPTPVGVFLAFKLAMCRIVRLPHARGGVSFPTWGCMTRIRSSPRPWGCFLRGLVHRPQPRVFPTPVGVFLTKLKRSSPKMGLPHARGGVSRLFSFPR